MRWLSLLLLFGFSAALAAPAAETVDHRNPKDVYPKDVAKFIEARALCDHLRQEEPYDEERRLYLKLSIEKNCTGTDSELTKLKKKYRKKPLIVERLSTYPAIEPIQAQPAEVASPVIDTPPPVLEPEAVEPAPTPEPRPYKPPPDTIYQ